MLVHPEVNLKPKLSSKQTTTETKISAKSKSGEQQGLPLLQRTSLSEGTHYNHLPRGMIVLQFPRSSAKGN